jgi:hypothetical protein
MKFHTRAALALVALCAAPLCTAGAQGLLGAPPTATQCQEWTAGLAAGGTAALNAVTYGNVSRCTAEAPAALAAAVRGARASADTAYLGRLASTTADVKDPAVFSAALEVAADERATDRARVMALLVTVGQLGSGQDVEDRTRPQLFTEALPATGVCGFEISASAPVIDNPLPADAEVQAARVIDGIRAARGQSALLQNLARCARSVTSVEAPPQVNVSGIKVDYVCGNRFRVQNHSGAPVTLTVATEGTSQIITVAAPDIGGWTAFTAPAAGTVRVTLDGQFVATVANGGRRCGGGG